MNFQTLIGHIHFCLELENHVLQTYAFWQNHKGKYSASFNTQKKHTLIMPGIPDYTQERLHDQTAGSVHGYLITCKKQTFYLKSFLKN